MERHLGICPSGDLTAAVQTGTAAFGEAGKATEDNNGVAQISYGQPRKGNNPM